MGDSLSKNTFKGRFFIEMELCVQFGFPRNLITFLPFVAFNNRAGVVFGQVMHTKQLLLVSVMCET